jgi:uncharacterized protein
MVIKRNLSNKIKELASQFRVLTLLGPRQSGKTTLIRHCFPKYTYVSLEEPDVRLYAQNDPRGFFKDFPNKVIIDEIQRVPELLSYIQSIVDKTGESGQFLLTGSDQLQLGATISQSLAGRTAVLTLLPLALAEIATPHISKKQSIDQWLIKGLMPAVHSQSLAPYDYYLSYFKTYVERDIRQLVNLKNFNLFEKFIKLSAGRVGQLINYSSLASDVGVAVTTINEWIALLEASYLIFRLKPHYENFGKRVIKSPKIYFTDVGLLCYLLEIENESQLKRDPLRGGIFENFIVLEALKSRYNQGKESNLYYFRDNHGREVDLLLSVGRNLIPIEIKAADTWHSDFAKNVLYFQKIAGEKALKGRIVYTGEYKRDSDNFELLPFIDCNWIEISSL